MGDQVVGEMSVVGSLAPSSLDAMCAGLAAIQAKRALPAALGSGWIAIEELKAFSPPQEFQGLALARTKRKLAKMRAGKS